MSKQSLSIFSAIAHVVAAFLLFVDGFYIWHMANSGKQPIDRDFAWMFDNQLDLAFILYVTLIFILLGAVISVANLFTDVDAVLGEKFTWWKPKANVIIPIISLILLIVFGMIGCAYEDDYIYNDTLCSVWVEFGMIFYVECALLIASIIAQGLRIKESPEQ